VNPPTPPSAPGDFGAAVAALEAIDRLTSEIRHELAEIRRDMARDSEGYDGGRCAVLQEANENLVLAAVDAEHRAECVSAELAELTQSSQFDALTQTPNRSLMSDRIDEALMMARRHDVCLALLYLDLDGFKQVNDTAGHAAGDELLKRIAARLRLAVRESDTVSRRGGDEFLVLLPEVSGRAAAARIAEKMLGAVAEPVSLDGKTSFSISASIGIALRPDDGDDAATLIGRADEAMYDAKRRGRNTFRFSGLPGEAEGDRPRVLSARDQLLQNLRDVNEQLLIAALRAQELLDAAEVARERHGHAMAVLAHELRNPLAPIRTAGQWLLAACSGDPRIEKAAAVIDRQAAQLTRLINDLLDGARGGSHGFRLQRAPVRLKDVLERSIEATHATVISRRQLLKARLPSDAAILNADAMRLEQVFSNLLDNASKYTPAGGRIDVSVDEGDADWVTVTVRDDGGGIAAEILPHIFDLFVQEPRFFDSGPDGLGIGLAVVRELVQAHAGSVEARSPGVGGGSEFVVRLPRSEGPPPG
jgi:diguanylate cyclase (GGDEF)-like protein